MIGAAARRVAAGIAAAAALAAPAAAERPARVVSGLAFALTLSQGGRSISSDRVSLRIPDTKGTLVVRLDSYDIAGGRFSAPLRLENRTDADLYALRVDLVSETESSGPTAGSPSPARVHPATAAPLTWAGLAKGAESSTLDLVASPVVFSPDTSMVLLLGVVTGVARTGELAVEAAKSAVALDADAGGNLFLTDAAGRVVRTGPDGAGPRELRGAAPVQHGRTGGPCAPHRAAGRVCAEAPQDAPGVWTAEGDEVSVFEPGGARVRSFRLPGGPISDVAFGKGGRVYLLRRGGTITVLRAF